MVCALIGDSLGGTVSLLTALQYPHTFGKVITQLPLVDKHVMKAVQAFQEPHLLELYHVIGTQEIDVPTAEMSPRLSEWGLLLDRRHRTGGGEW